MYPIACSAPERPRRSASNDVRPSETRSPRMFKPRVFVLGALACLPLGCITSSMHEGGATKASLETKLSRCPDGLIDDLEDGDSQIVKKEGREGYWFTFTDTYGSTITPKGDFKADT